MKTFSCIILCSLLIVGSMLFAGEWYGFIGYVYDDGEPVVNATVLVWEYPEGENGSTQTNEEAYYEYSCPRGWYGMEASKHGKTDLQCPVYNTGQQGGVWVNFDLFYDTK
jgi:hypothetical protein